MKFFFTLCTFICALMLQGCGSEEIVSNEHDTPGDTAKKYFETLYNAKDLDTAALMATPKLARIMKSYGTAKQFTRNLVNLQYDEVVIEVDMTEMSVRQQYGDRATINLIFTGHFNGKKIDDMRSVKMLIKKGDWYVDKINPDPYAR